eukprot:gnl/MRDRNA2_/MRDRNA2_75219_c0_seq1.p1 gnl/MRDRNA2_/MRDRNA2_75219_c0~~gnl/MRDRNA2_/MRDRNA2_75219_c0_seq1.p1  ORF type:complete len:1186 (+),score=279.21 gnl/MRDRNA2_/MRDRNA2_75219_c0_seq1:125-3682(+)
MSMQKLPSTRKTVAGPEGFGKSPTRKGSESPAAARKSASGELAGAKSKPLQKSPTTGASSQAVKGRRTLLNQNSSPDLGAVNSESPSPAAAAPRRTLNAAKTVPDLSALGAETQSPPAAEKRRTLRSLTTSDLTEAGDAQTIPTSPLPKSRTNSASGDSESAEPQDERRKTRKSASGLGLSAGAEESSNAIKVCVRVRPFAPREAGETCCIDMPEENLKLLIVKGVSEGHTATDKDFTFDRAYWSHNESDPHYATQQTLMDELGEELITNAMIGYNDTLFAYGQTGSGKTHSVIGGKDLSTEAGLLPRMIHRIFNIIDATKETDEGEPITFRCSTSYLEIYNDKLKDLLVPPSKTEEKLEVRNHPMLGICVPGLVEAATSTADEVERMMEFGMKTRSIAATSMNDRSSRSHCIFIFQMSQIIGNVEKPKQQLKSKINLVDLAGSERQKKTNATGDRLKEGSMINQSLSNLAICINKLAASFSTSHKGKKDNADFIPFRNTKLTYILQESLVGNSKTVMMAAISPAVSNMEETLSTLRFAQSVKKIQTAAKKNESSDQDMVSKLKAEIEKLRQQARGGGGLHDEDTEDLQEQLRINEELARRFQQDYEEQLKEAKALEEARSAALEDMGLSTDEITAVYKLDPNTPHLVNISDDPSLSGALMYFLEEGVATLIGSDEKCKIRLTGLGVKAYMCQITNDNHIEVKLLQLTPDGSICDDATYNRECGRVLVNGHSISGERHLHHTDRLIIGRSFCFRVLVPKVAAEQAEAKERDGEVQDGEGAAEADVPDLESALTEVVDEQCEEYVQCRTYVRELEDRVGRDQAQDWLKDFAKLLPLVQEANEITAEIRPQDRLRLSIEVVSDLFTYSNDAPELVVRVWKGLTGAKRWRAIVRNKVLQKLKARMYSVLGLFQNMIEQLRGPEPDEYVVCVWEVPQFKERLNHFREIFERYVEDGKVDFREPGSDPWAEYSFREVQDMLQAAQLENDEKLHKVRAGQRRKGLGLSSDQQKDIRLEIAKRLHREDWAVRGSLMGGGNALADELQKTLEAGNADELARLEQQAADQDERISDLEEQLEQAEGANQEKDEEIQKLKDNAAKDAKALAKLQEELQQLRNFGIMPGQERDISGMHAASSSIFRLHAQQSEKQFDGAAVIARMHAAVRQFEDQVEHWSPKRTMPHGYQSGGKLI